MYSIVEDSLMKCGVDRANIDVLAICTTISIYLVASASSVSLALSWIL